MTKSIQPGLKRHANKQTCSEIIHNFLLSSFWQKFCFSKNYQIIFSGLLPGLTGGARWVPLYWVICACLARQGVHELLSNQLVNCPTKLLNISDFYRSTYKYKRNSRAINQSKNQSIGRHGVQPKEVHSDGFQVHTTDAVAEFADADDDGDGDSNGGNHG